MIVIDGHLWTIANLADVAEVADLSSLAATTMIVLTNDSFNGMCPHNYFIFKLLQLSN